MGLAYKVLIAAKLSQHLGIQAFGSGSGNMFYEIHSQDRSL